MGLADIFTGGHNDDAADALSKAQATIGAVPVPSIQSLSLPQLQEYVNAGVMTPAEAQSYLQQSNAYNTENVDQTGTGAMVQALNQLSDISDSGPMGTPQEQAQIGQATDTANQQTAGQRGAIEQDMQAKGTPAAMIQAALMNQYQGQDASQAHRDSLQAQAQAYQQAVQALSEKAGVGQALQGQQNTQANTVAGAQNAMQQFNANNQQQNSQFNAANKQQANAYNTQTAQNVSNQNTGLANQRTEYNAQVPETVFNNQMQKATGQANVYGQQANQATAAGQQEAGVYSGLIGAGSTMGGDYLLANGKNPVGAKTAATGGVVGHDGCYHDGGICMDDGGMIPGRAEVPGDSLKNDKVKIMASPGEAVIPRTSVQEHLPEVLSLIAGGHGGNQPEQHHPQDVASLLHAMRSIRMGAV